MKATVEIRRQGKVTIPKAIVKSMNLKPGMFIEMDVSIIEVNTKSPISQ